METTEEAIATQLLNYLTRNDYNRMVVYDGVLDKLYKVACDLEIENKMLREALAFYMVQYSKKLFQFVNEII